MTGVDEGVRAAENDDTRWDAAPALENVPCLLRHKVALRDPVEGRIEHEKLEVRCLLSDGARQYRLGWRVTSAVAGDAGFEIDLDATRRESANDNAGPEHRIGFRMTTRW